MKKHIYWILPTVVFLFIIALYTFVPYIYTFWFRLRHALVYGLAVYLIVFLLYLFVKWITTRYHIPKTGVFLIGALLGTGFVIIAFTLSTLQMRYIELYEIPPLKSCTYYDDYGNFLYASQYQTSCPDIENVHKDNIDGQNTLTFTVKEDAIGQARIVSTVDNDLFVQEFEMDATLETVVSITYFQKRFVEEITLISREIQHRTNAYDQSKTTYVKLVSKTVTNVLGEDAMKVITNSAVYEESFPQHITATFPNPSTLDYETVTITSTISPNDTYEFFIDIDKHYQKDEEIVTETFLRGSYKNLNDPLFELDYYTDQRATGSSLNAYFAYGDTTFKQIEESASWYGVDGSYMTRYITFMDTPISFYEVFEEGEFHVFKDFRFEGSASLRHLSNDYTSTYMIAQDTLYSMQENQTSKYHKTDYGYKIEEYSTRRYNNGSYYRDLQKRPGYLLTSIFNIQTGNSFEEYYDYETLLQTPGVLSKYHFYQHNFLLEGHFMKD